MRQGNRVSEKTCKFLEFVCPVRRLFRFLAFSVIFEISDFSSPCRRVLRKRVYVTLFEQIGCSNISTGISEARVGPGCHSVANNRFHLSPYTFTSLSLVYLRSPSSLLDLFRPFSASSVSVHPRSVNSNRYPKTVQTRELNADEPSRE